MQWELITIYRLANNMTEATSSFLLDFVVRAAFLPLDQDWNGRDLWQQVDAGFQQFQTRLPCSVVKHGLPL